ncbi:MAG: PAS-domain containing protein [Alphaproteobacteria bacterium]
MLACLAILIQAGLIQTGLAQTDLAQTDLAGTGGGTLATGTVAMAPDAATPALFVLALSISALALVGLAAVIAWRARRATRQAMRQVSETDAARAAAEALAGQAALQRDSSARSLANLEAVISALPEIAWRRDRERRLVWVNTLYAEAVERPVAVVLAEQIELATPAQARELASRAQATGERQSVTSHVVVAGSRRLLVLQESPTADGGLIGLASDLTDLEESRRELARHVASHDEVLENLATAMAVFDSQQRLTFFNSAFMQLWRFEEAWLRSEPGFSEVLERLRETRQVPETGDFQRYRHDRQQLFTSLLAPYEELVHLPDERTIRERILPHPFGGLQFTYEDVTDRLVLERSYNTLIAVQRETLNNLFEAVAVFGADGRLKLHNAAFARMWSLPDTVLEGEPHVSRIVAAMGSLLPESGDALDRRENTLVAEITNAQGGTESMTLSDGRILEVARVALPDGGTLISMLDATDRRQVERALRERNEALETADRMKTEFIGGVSYELRTPLNTIIGFGEILDQAYFGELNPRQKEYTTGILSASRSLKSLIDDMLDLATIDAGYMQLSVQTVAVDSLLDDTVALCRQRAYAVGLDLDLDCAPDIGEAVWDATRIKQAIFGLLSNAMTFTEAGGQISLVARAVAGFPDATADNPPDGVIEITVHDTGIGIASQDQARIFGRFERGGSQAGRVGAGLGLALVKSFIEMHGGRIALTSAPGEGTTVTCHLPRRPDVTTDRRAEEQAAE